MTSSQSCSCSYPRRKLKLLRNLGGQQIKSQKLHLQYYCCRSRCINETILSASYFHYNLHYKCHLNYFVNCGLGLANDYRYVGGPFFYKIVVQGIGGSRGAPPAHPPQQDPILSFLHTFLPKSAHIGGRRPPKGSAPPPTGNPGSATARVYDRIVMSLTCCSCKLLC